MFQLYQHTFSPVPFPILPITSYSINLQIHSSINSSNLSISFYIQIPPLNYLSNSLHFHRFLQSLLVSSRTYKYVQLDI